MVVCGRCPPPQAPASAALAALIALASGVSPAVAAEDRVTADGDLVALSDAKEVRPGGRLARSAVVRVVAGSELPKSGSSAVVVSVRAAAASRSGRVLVGPAGAKPKTTAVAYRRGAAAVGQALVKVGRGDRIVLRSTAGAPKVSVVVRARVPKTSMVVVPSQPSSPSQLASGTRAALVSISVAGARKAGRLSLKGSKQAVASYGRGSGTSLALVPIKGRAVPLRASSGKPRVTAKVVGSTLEGGQVTAARRPSSAGTVRGTRKLTLLGRFGVPASGVRSVVVSALGARTSSLQVVELDARGAGRVNAVGRRSKVVVLGWLADPGAGRTSYVPRPGTVVLGAGDVVAEDSRALTLDPSAQRPTVGGFVYARVPGRSGMVLGRVDGVSKVGGRTVAALSDAPLEAAFSDYDAQFDGPLTAGPGAARASQALKLSVPLAKPDLLDCTAGQQIPLLKSWSLDLEDANIHLDLSLAERSIDFSTTGRLVGRVELTGGDSSLSCEINEDKLGNLIKLLHIPLGASGFEIKFKPKVSLTASAPNGPSALTVTAQIAAGFSYINGERSGLHAVGLGATVEEAPGSLSLKAGVSAGVGLAFLLEKASPLDPSASVTAGGALTLGPPEAGEDGQLKGPRCIDLTANGFVDIGARVAIELLGDISFSVPAFETEKFSLFKGPCWGYEGTILYKASGEIGGGGMDRTVVDEGVLLTMLNGTPLRVHPEGQIIQPYRWSAYNRTTAYRTCDVEGSQVERQVRQESGAGEGTRLHRSEESDPNPVFGVILSVSGEEFDLANVANTGYSGLWPSNVGEDGRTTLPGTSWRADCSDGSRVDADFAAPVVYGGATGRFARVSEVPERILGTAGGNTSDGTRQDIAYDLTRVEVPR